MLKLSNCSNEKHNGWWDFEAEIQKELEALDAHDNAQASGSPQVEEKENVNMVDGVADDFKYLIDRFHLQEEKLLHFEKYVLSPRKWPDALLEDSTTETAYPEAGLDSAADSCSSHSCFLTQQYLIRPLYCIDQEENLCLNQERNDKENYYSCKKKEVSKRNLVKEHSTRVMPEVWSVRQMERVKGFSMHDVRKIQGHQRIRTVQKIKDRVLHSLYLNSTESMLNELKLKNSDVKSHRTDFFSDTALMPCQYKGSKAVSIKLGSGTASFDGCQMDALLTRPKGTLTQWKMTVVTNVSYDMTRTRMPGQCDITAHVVTCIDKNNKLKELNIIAYAGTHFDKYFSAPCKLKMNIADGYTSCALPFLPQLNKAVLKLFDQLGQPSQDIWSSHFFQKVFWMCRQQLCSGDASAKVEQQMVFIAKFCQVIEKTKHNVCGCNHSSSCQCCSLEHTLGWGDDERVLEENEDVQSESDARLQEIVKLQAGVRGFLARKHYRTRLESQESNLSLLASRIQAYWRCYILRRACLNGDKSKIVKTVGLSSDGCSQHNVNLETFTYLRRIVILQALARGFFARKNPKFMLHQKEKNACFLASKIQALWKGRRVRTSNVLKQLHVKKMLQNNALVKLQALWRGFRTRKRFQVALKGSTYNDHDDFDYALVNEKDYLPRDPCFKELSTVCYQRDTNNFQLFLESNSLQEIHENQVQFKFNENGIKYTCDEKPKEDAKEITYREQFECMKEETLKEKEALASADLSCFQRNWTDGDNSTISHLEEAFRDERVDLCHHKTLGGKHQQNINETKAAMAEIAKDWGFKEERTALQFLRALNNTRRRAETLTTLKPDAQARLRKFMARSGRHKEISKTVPDTKTLGQR